MSFLGSLGKVFSTAGTVMSAIPGLGTIPGVAASAAGGLMSQMGSEKDQQRLYQQQLLFNSPREQMKRLREAGLNENLVYGSQGVTGMSSSDATAPNLEQYKENPVLKMTPQQIQEMAIQREHQNNENRMTTSNESLNKEREKTEQAKQRNLDSDTTTKDNYNSMFDVVKGIKEAELDYKQLQNESQKLNNSILSNKVDMSAQELKEMLDTWPTRQKTIEQELTNKIKQGKLLDAEAARQFAEISLIPLRANLLKAQEGLVSRQTINAAIEAGLMSDKHKINEATIKKIQAEMVSTLLKTKGTIVEMYDHKGVGSWIINPVERLIHSGEIQSNLNALDSLLFP